MNGLFSVADIEQAAQDEHERRGHHAQTGRTYGHGTLSWSACIETSCLSLSNALACAVPAQPKQHEVPRIPRYDPQNPLTGVPTSPEDVKHPECPQCDHGTFMHGVGGCWACECKQS